MRARPADTLQGVSAQKKDPGRGRPKARGDRS
jgi:hypothetical protein